MAQSRMAMMDRFAEKPLLIRVPLPPEVLDDLRVEGDGPGDKVDPPDDGTHHLELVRVDHIGADEGPGHAATQTVLSDVSTETEL